MTTFGLRPDDVVTDTKGNVLDGAAVKLYATQDDASNQINLLGTAYTDPKGRWTFSTDVALVWARTANGLIWRVDSDEEDHGQMSGLLDDDHPQYALADGSRGNFEAAGAVAAHEAASDPHPQYLTQAEGDALYGAGGAGAQQVWDHYDSGQTYDTGSVVNYLGFLWYSLTDGNIGNPPDTSLADWEKFDFDGYLDSVPVFWPTWGAGGTYDYRDTVEYGGKLYWSNINANSGTTPGTDATKWVEVDLSGYGGGGGVTDHGALTGLGDDDHTQYALADGSRGTFEAAGAVAAHSADTTAVHGISDTSKLVVSSDSTITDVIALTQTAYDAIGTKSATTLYVITGA